jgi:hypothetical protein
MATLAPHRVDLSYPSEGDVMKLATEKPVCVRSFYWRVSLAWARSPRSSQTQLRSSRSDGQPIASSRLAATVRRILRFGLRQSRAHAFDWISFLTCSKATVPVGLALLFVWFGSGCSKQAAIEAPPVTTPPAAVRLDISPKYLELKPGSNWSFSATVLNAKDTSVTWSIEEGSAGGAITDTGVYTAPGTDGDYHVIATSNADKTKSATATVSIGATIFTLTGSLNTGRAEHTATLLPDGQVFIAGGGDSTGAIASLAEQFDPVQGAFHSAGTVTRLAHTATRLANGDVLFAGGLIDLGGQPPDVTASAELLKAGTGMLEPTGSMILPRSGHTATLLQDGRVLIAGGLIQSGTTDIATETAELYDPASGTFSQTASMNEPRIFHSAIPLLNGKVLIVGMRSAELYDPATNTFTVTSGAPVARFDSIATLLADGKVLITGGALSYADMYAGPSELFDPVTEQFTPTGTMTIPRWAHTATLLADGTVLIAGGWVDVDGENPATQTTEIYNPATGSFSPGPRMMYGRASHTATLLSDGSVLFAGGYGIGALSTAEIYK